MAISFFNVRTGEKRTVDTEPMIAAFFNSGDQHVNATVGQDFGWRIAPETVKRMREIQSDPQKMAQIAATFQLPLDGVSKTDVLRWISLEDARAKQQKKAEEDYSRQYEAEIRALDDETEEKQPVKSKSQERRETVQKEAKSNKADSAEQTDSAKIDASSNETKEK